MNTKPHLRERSKAATSVRKSRRAPKQKELKLDWNKTYKTKQVCKIFQVSPRNIQYWTEQKLLNPKLETGKAYEHGGTIRSFGMRDLILVGVMVALKKKGLSLRKVRKVVLQIVPDIETLLLAPEGTRIRFSSRHKHKTLAMVKIKSKSAVFTPALGDTWVKVRVRSTGATPKPAIFSSFRDILNRIERGRP